MATPSWDRQPGEPPAWFARFHAYRLLGRTRTIEAVWRQEAKVGKGKRPPRQWYAVAQEWEWKERAAAWDIFKIGEDAEEQAERRRETLDAAFAILREKLPDLEQQRFSPRTWAEVLKIVCAEQRIEYGQVPVQKHEVSGKDGAPIAPALDLSVLSDDEVAVLASIAERIESAGSPSGAGSPGKR
jgi:hypothetical protein